MKAVDSRVIVPIDKSGTEVQKIGCLEIPIGSDEYEVGKVISVGPKAEGINEGDTVYVYPNAGKIFHHGGQEFKVISTSEIIVII